MLHILDAATSLDDLRVPPSNRLETLKGDRVGHHSIRINDQWRDCFRWEAGNAHACEIRARVRPLAVPEPCWQFVQQFEPDSPDC